MHFNFYKKRRTEGPNQLSTWEMGNTIEHSSLVTYVCVPMKGGHRPYVRHERTLLLPSRKFFGFENYGMQKATERHTHPLYYL